MILLLRISLLSVLHLDFLSWSFSTALIQAITATLKTELQRKATPPSHHVISLKSSRGYPPCIHCRLLSPPLYWKCYCTFGHSLCLVKHSSRLPVFYWLIFLVLHPPASRIPYSAGFLLLYWILFLCTHQRLMGLRFCFSDFSSVYFTPLVTHQVSLNDQPDIIT